MLLPPLLDVAIIGAGPAGCAAARQLARWGHSVALLAKPPSSRPLAESLPPSCGKLFEALDLTGAIEAAGFIRSTGNTVWWGGDGQRVEPFPEGRRGWQVLRSALDRVLIEAAEHAGAQVVRDAAVRDVELATDAGGRHVLRVPSLRQAVSARVLLDCSGRAGVVARRGFRQHERSSTVALVGVWQREGGFGLPDESHTLVEAYADGWTWSVPIADSVRYVAAMVDPRVSGVERAKDVGRIYAAELGKTRELQRILAGAASVETPWACDASTYTASQFAGPGFLLVGDAASFIDPLSSYGVKKALASAWLASIVAHTALVTPDMWGPAAGLFSRREHDMFAAAARQMASHFAAAGARHAHAFWAGRAEQRGDALEEEVDIEALRRDPDVLLAFEALRRAPAVRFRPARDVRVEPGPAVAGSEIVLAPRLVCPAFPGGVRFVRGVELPALLELAPAERQVPDLFEAYNRIRPPVILPDFLGALSVLIGKGLLEMTATDR